MRFNQTNISSPLAVILAIAGSLVGLALLSTAQGGSRPLADGAHSVEDLQCEIQPLTEQTSVPVVRVAAPTSIISVDRAQGGGEVVHEVEVPGYHWGTPGVAVLPAFNPKLGELTGVRVDVGMEVLWHMGIENLYQAQGSYVSACQSWIPGPWDPNDPNYPWPSPGDGTGKVPGEFGGPGLNHWWVEATLRGTSSEATRIDNHGRILFVQGSRGDRNIPSPYDGESDWQGPSGGSVFDFHELAWVDGGLIFEPLVLQRFATGKPHAVVDLEWQAGVAFTSTGGHYTLCGCLSRSRVFVRVTYLYN